jgi:hypothetical protein
MAAKLMARLVFDSDSYPDLAAEELSTAGYTVHRMSAGDLRRYSLLDDHIEAVIAGSADDKIMDAVWREVEDIIRPYGGFLFEIRTIDSGYIPFERETTPLL